MSTHCTTLSLSPIASGHVNRIEIQGTRVHTFFTFTVPSLTNRAATLISPWLGTTPDTNNSHFSNLRGPVRQLRRYATSFKCSDKDLIRSSSADSVDTISQPPRQSLPSIFKHRPCASRNRFVKSGTLQTQIVPLITYQLLHSI